MAGANSQINLVGLDFDTIKNNLKTFLKSQDTFKDYNFEGSGMSVLLDVLAYNTQYNSFYLNMVANEMFLDTSLQRSSVISHAKLLDYSPKSYVAPKAIVHLVANNVTDSSITIPSYTNFVSEPIDKITYNFVTTESHTVNVINGTATFNDIELKQGIPVEYSFIVDSQTNPNYTFNLPDSTIDTSTIKIIVQTSETDTSFETYNLAKSYLDLNSSSLVFFIQESFDGTYDLIFGNGILGKKLTDGNKVIVNYITTQGNSSASANSFTLMDSVPGVTNFIVYSKVPADNGGEKESIDSIKYQAPKSYAAQGRAVTKEDYITAIQNNNLGISFDAVNVWGGEENDPPVYGQLFVSLKPQGSYQLTQLQKQKITNEVLKPISVMTVSPTIVDPDYTYIRIDCNVIYDPVKTTKSASELKTDVINAIKSFANSTLNTFNSNFMMSGLIMAIQQTNASIITNETSIKLQKKFYPSLTSPATYNLYFGTELAKGYYNSNISSSPSMRFREPINLSNIIDGVYLEEIPSTTRGIESVDLINAGFSYQSKPTVTINGDGFGAKAEATINEKGQISYITVLESGNNYTSATVTITPASSDNTGKNAVAIANLKGRYGTLRSFYNNVNQVKTIFNQDVGTIDYAKGVVTLRSFDPVQINDELGKLVITATPVSSILSSTYNRILTVDVDDKNAINVNIIAKK